VTQRDDGRNIQALSRLPACLAVRRIQLECVEA